MIPVEDKTYVDKRILGSGKTRLRFKLDEISHRIVIEALKHTAERYQHVALDYLCIEFQATYELKFTLNGSSKGNQRFLVRLYPDQYECVRSALNLARHHAESDEDALTLICAHSLPHKKLIKLGVRG